MKQVSEIVVSACNRVGRGEWKDGKVNLEKDAICFNAGVIPIASCGSEIEISPEEKRITDLEDRVRRLNSDLHQSNEETEDLTIQLIDAINDRGLGISMSLGIDLGMVLFPLVPFNLKCERTKGYIKKGHKVRRMF